MQTWNKKTVVLEGSSNVFRGYSWARTQARWPSSKQTFHRAMPFHSKSPPRLLWKRAHLIPKTMTSLRFICSRNPINFLEGQKILSELFFPFEIYSETFTLMSSDVFQNQSQSDLFCMMSFFLGQKLEIQLAGRFFKRMFEPWGQFNEAEV